MASSTKKRLRQAVLAAKRAARKFKKGDCRHGQSALRTATHIAGEVARGLRRTRSSWTTASAARRALRLKDETTFRAVDEAIEDAIVAEGKCERKRR